MVDDRRSLLGAVLARLDRGDAKDDKYPDSKGEYWTLCPFPSHGDKHSGSFSVSERGYNCFACHAKGSLAQLAEHLGIERRTVARMQSGRQGTQTHSLTLKEYAEAKHLPLELLREWGLRDSPYRGQARVAIPYLDANSQQLYLRYRCALHGSGRFTLARGTKLALYGLWKLHEARDAGYVFLVEGESDTHTLWAHGLPAIGLPGAGTFKAEWATELEGIPIYVWQEPDQGGSTMVNTLAKALPDFYLMKAPEGRKDISEAHILGDDVSALMARLKAEAKLWSTLQSHEREEQAQQYLETARPLLESEDLLDRLADVCHALGLVGEDSIAKVLYLALTSRLLDEPVSIVVKGPSSGGKSYAVKTVLRLFPETAYLDLTSMSDHALIYDDRPIAHRFIILYEASGLGQDRQGEPSILAYCVRSLLSEGVIKYTTIEKTDEGMQPRVIEREGPSGLITTTTWSSLHAENETRMVSLEIKDTPAQTALVLAAVAQRYTGAESRQIDLAPWMALQSWLALRGAAQVTIPYGDALAQLSNPRAVRLRRDFGKVLTLVQAHALLNQFRRERNSAGQVVATIADYRAIYDLLTDIIDQGVEATVRQTVRDTVEAVRELLGAGAGRPVTYAMVAKQLELDSSAAYRRVRSAISLGYIVNVQDKHGQPAKLVLGEPLPEEQAVLPSPEKVEECVFEIASVGPAIVQPQRQERTVVAERIPF